MLQSCLTFLPEHAEFINEHCAKVCENGRVTIHNASGVMLSYLQFDDYGRAWRLAYEGPIVAYQS